MVITTRQKEVKNKQTNYNGGYLTYWKLMKKFRIMLKEHKHILKFHQRVWVRISAFLQFVFKPMLYVFHRVILYHSLFTLTENGELLKIISFSKESTLYLFRFIPIWYSTSDNPKTKEDYEIFK